MQKPQRNAALLTLLGFCLIASACHKGEVDGVSARQCSDLRTEQVVFVPGSFNLGSEGFYREERPVKEVSVGAFAIQNHEVTNDQFAAFVAATGYVTRAERGLDPTVAPDLPDSARVPGAMVFAPFAMEHYAGQMDWWVFVPGASWRHPFGPETSIDGKGKHPVVQVTLEDAEAYANWSGERLPSEHEWEYAARQSGNRQSPSGTDAPKEANVWQGLFPLQNTQADGFRGTAPVGCFKPTEDGLYDMIGNVWEMTRSPYYPSHEPGQLRETHPAGFMKGFSGAPVVVLKGGSHLCAENFCVRYRPEARQPQDQYLGSSHIGFRTTKSLSTVAEQTSPPGR